MNRISEEEWSTILGHRNINATYVESCSIVREYCQVKSSAMATVSKYFIITLAAIHLVKEIFQITQVSYFKNLS